MKLSYNWLKSYVSIPSSPDEMAAMLTGCGLEVESVEVFQTITGGLEGLIVGHVLEKSKHPNADKLSITQVDTGNGMIKQIVCGASNVEAGQKVIVAEIGATLYPHAGEPFTIKKSKIRGEYSEGMICAEDEIGMGNSHSGIMVLPPDTPTGTTAADYFHIHPDYIFEIGLTPNRADATSHIGAARDLAAVWNAHVMIEAKDKALLTCLAKPEIIEFNPQVISPIKIKVEDALACPRYSGIYFSGVVVKESPAWLKEKLQAVGIKPINNIVDVTNFVMLETGQPLHAFDAAKIADHQIVVKKLPVDTIFITLDRIERKLNGEEIMICDSREGLCIGGVYGGLHSGISPETTELFIESAYFNPTLIRKGSRHHNLKTDASFRFERGADPEITVYALHRAVQLFRELEITAGYSNIQDYYPAPIIRHKVTLELQKVAELTGVNMHTGIIKNILTSLEIKITDETPTEMMLEIPLFKPDVKRHVDVIEELLRIYGYNRVPLPKKMNSSLPHFFHPDNSTIQSGLSAYLSANGFHEMMGNSLTKSNYSNMEGAQGKPVKMLNPLSNDLAILRQSLIWSALEAISYNTNRKSPDLRFFEFGKVYFNENGHYKEENQLLVTMSGRREKPNWINKNESYSVYYLKSLALNLLKIAGLNTDKFVFNDSDDPFLHVAMQGCFNQKQLVSLGIIKKQVLNHFDLEGEIFVIRVMLDQVFRQIESRDRQMTEIPKYPEVKRDLSMVFNQQTSFEEVEKIARETERNLLKSIQLFDVYQGDKIEAGKKSFAISFILADHEKTLDEKQIEYTMNRLMKNFEEKLGAVIRKS